MGIACCPESTLPQRQQQKKEPEMFASIQLKTKWLWSMFSSRPLRAITLPPAPPTPYLQAPPNTPPATGSTLVARKVNTWWKWKCLGTMEIKCRKGEKSFQSWSAQPVHGALRTRSLLLPQKPQRAVASLFPSHPPFPAHSSLLSPTALTFTLRRRNLCFPVIRMRIYQKYWQFKNIKKLIYNNYIYFWRCRNYAKKDNSGEQEILYDRQIDR